MDEAAVADGPPDTDAVALGSGVAEPGAVVVEEGVLGAEAEPVDEVDELNVAVVVADSVAQADAVDEGAGERDTEAEPNGVDGVQLADGSWEGNAEGETPSGVC